MVNLTLDRQEASELPARVMGILDHHRGSGNAITGLCIARMLGYKNDRLIRVVISQLIAEGKPIAASVSEPLGYYLVETEQEAEVYERVLRSRALRTFERLRDFQRAITQVFGIPYQPVLFSLDGMDPASVVRDADDNEMG